MKKKTLIIAEAGVNHDGVFKKACRLIENAVAAKADIVKFQTFSPESLVTQDAKMAAYQKKNLRTKESQYEMLKKLALSKKEFLGLKKLCDELGIEFLSTAFDTDSLNFLVNEVGIRRIKIPSGEITNVFLLHRATKFNLPILLSTGASTINDVRFALDLISYGLVEQGKVPCSNKDFQGFSKKKIGLDALRKNEMTILQCTSNYPADFNELNLRVIRTYMDEFHTRVGFSDHSAGISASIAAVALGAEVIEKHFTLDTNAKGPDHAASLPISEFQKLVCEVRNVEMAMGSGKKTLSHTEIGIQKTIRKSIVAKSEIKKGEIIKLENLAILRPEAGLSASKGWDLVGTLAKRPYKKNEVIR